jgi:hypothetical protein
VSLAKDVRALPAEMRLAALAAGALAVSLILPWYQKSYFQGQKVVQANVSALGVFTFVEAAVLLVALAVLFLVWARSQRKGFHLPGGDGAAITLAGAWALLLLVWRLFDKPDIKGVGVTVGIQWGIFGALLAAGALVAAGARVRAAHRPEPPNPAADDVDWVDPDRPTRPRDRRPRDSSTVAEAWRDRPAWEGEPGEPPRPAPRRGGDEETRRFRDDDPATRRVREPEEDVQTRRVAETGDEAKTRRMPDPDDTAKTRRTADPDDTARTRRMAEPDDTARTRRMAEPDDTARTRRMAEPDNEARTRGMPEPGDEAKTHRMVDPPDEATRRFRDDDAETRRLPADPESPRLWDDP